MVEIYIKHKDTVVQTRWPFDEPIMSALRFSGFDPYEFNRITWPTGCTRFARGRFLLHQSDLDALRASLRNANLDIVFGNAKPVRLTLVMGGRTFDAMHMIYPRPILTPEEGGALYAVDLVDGRYWSTREYSALGSGVVGGNDSELLVNGTLDDGVTLFDITTDGGSGGSPGSTWTGLAVLQDLIPSSNTLAITYLPTDEWDLADDADRLSSTLYLRDFSTHFQTVGDNVDRLLQSHGYILVAYPTMDSQGAGRKPGGFRYRTVSIESGGDEAIDILRKHADDLIGGGLWGHQGFDILPGGAKNALGAIDDIYGDAPYTLDIALQGRNRDSIDHFLRNDKDHSTATSSYHPFQVFQGASASGPHSLAPAKLHRPRARMYGSLWADDTTNRSAYANGVANMFYARFHAGVGDMIFRGCLDINPFSGAGEIVWSVTPVGPTTRIRGSFDDPMFGWNYEQPIRPIDVACLGPPLTGCPTPWGGLRLAVRRPSAVYEGVITAVSGSSPNFLYDGYARLSPDITFEDKVPTRLSLGISGMSLTITAASANDMCWITVDENGAIDLFTPTEEYDYA